MCEMGEQKNYLVYKCGTASANLDIVFLFFYLFLQQCKIVSHSERHTENQTKTMTCIVWKEGKVCWNVNTNNKNQWK